MIRSFLPILPVSLAVTLVSMSSAPAAAQTPSAGPPLAGQPPVLSPPGPRLRVYLDCNCFQSYLRDEIDWVDFVRQPQDADVHLLSDTRETGGGGREVTLRFVGVRAFAGVDHDLRVVTMTGETENVRREAVLRTAQIGLLDYLAHRSLPGDLDVTVRSTVRAGAAAAAQASDPWNLWVFSIFGAASVDEDENNRDVNWDLNVSGDRVTDNWKFSVGASADMERDVQPPRRSG